MIITGILTLITAVLYWYAHGHISMSMQLY